MRLILLMTLRISGASGHATTAVILDQTPTVMCLSDNQECKQTTQYLAMVLFVLIATQLAGHWWQRHQTFMRTCSIIYSVKFSIFLFICTSILTKMNMRLTNASSPPRLLPLPPFPPTFSLHLRVPIFSPSFYSFPFFLPFHLYQSLLRLLPSLHQVFPNSRLFLPLNLLFD